MTDHNRTKSFRRALPAVMIVGIFLTLLAVLAWLQRPRWHTYTFPADPKTGIAVAIDYPEDWRLGTMIQPATEFSSSMRAEIVPLPPTGLTRWWMQKVLKQDIDYAESDLIELSVDSGAAYKDMATVEKESRAFRGPGCTLQLKHTRHTLGPMLDASVTLTPPFLGAGYQQTVRGYGVIIYPPAKTGGHNFSIGASTLIRDAAHARFEAAMAAMAPRIHLIKRP